MSNSVQPHRRQPTRLPHPWDSPGKNTGVGCHFLLQCMKGKSESEVAQLCPTLCDPMDCSPLGSSVHGILQARTLEWVALPFSRDSCWPRYWTGASCVADGFYTDWVTRNVLWQFCQIVIHFCFILVVTESSLLNHNNFLKAYICIICSHQIKLFN